MWFAAGYVSLSVVGLLTFSRGALADSQMQHGLVVHLTAPYRTTPTIETAEFISATTASEARFWEYVEARNKSEFVFSPIEAKQLDISLGAGEFIMRAESEARLSERLRTALGFSACSGASWAALEVSDGILATCDPKELSLSSTTSGSPDSCAALMGGKLEVTPLDHVFREAQHASGPIRTVIVHGDLEDESFFALWAGARSLLSRNPSWRLVLRPEPSPKRQRAQPRFGGFSIDLDIKNTEYVAVDRTSFSRQGAGEADASLESGIYFSTLQDKFKEDAETLAKLNSFRSSLKQSREKLKAWEIADVSIQLALDVMNASDPLAQFKEVTENLPVHARRLARIPVPDDIREAVAKRPRPGTQVRVNGVRIGMQADFGALLAQIRRLARLGEAGQRSGVRKSDVTRWTQSQSSQRVAWGQRLDVRKFAKGAVAFLNDIEKDQAYAGLPKSLDALRNAPRGHQQLITVRRNLYTCILALDPSDPAQIETLGVLRYFVRVGAPIRFGVVLTSGTLADTLSSETVKDLPVSEVSPCATEDACSSPRCLARLYAATRKAHGSDAAVASLMEMSTRFKDRRAPCSEVIDVFADAMAQELGAWSSGKYKSLAEKAFAGSDATARDADETVLRMARYVGALGLSIPSMTFNGRVFDLKNAKMRFDRLIQPVLFEEQGLLQEASDTLVDEEDVLGQILRLAGASQRNSKTINVPLGQMRFLSLAPEDLSGARPVYISAENRRMARVTVWAVRGTRHCRYAVSALKSSMERDDVRIGVLGSTTSSKPISTVAELADECGPAQVDGPLPLGLSSSTWLVANSRVVEASEEGELLTEGDVQALVDMERIRVSNLPSTLSADEITVAAGLLGFLQQVKSESASTIQVGMEGDDIVEKDENKDENKDIFTWRDHAKRNESQEEDDWTVFDVRVDADPLSPSTPSAAAFAEWMRSTLGARIELRLHPRPDVGQLPPSSFHRWAPAGQAVFAGLPLDQLLTLKVDAPRSWIVYAGDMGARDPDNLLMSEGGLTATYELTHVLLDGHATDVDSGEPAAGMQMELMEADGLLDSPLPPRRVADSMVMYNLGYWQLKARPGVFRVRPISGYALVKPNEPARAVALRDIAGAGPVELKVAKDPASATDAASSSGTVESNDGDTMHVFSLASGALYERFLRIMMLSVRKRSSGKVKFWLLENYMSSKMKSFLPAFAEKNDFAYELVTFKWPDWLRGQSERQRQIWGMKILFLDVLFPLSVKRIIYVDSDQVLRADLRELWRMDLQGAPYAMTPFCDSRKETLGFQFWRQGYWASHLRGKHYHISALFVVDLEAFRRDAVGDRLRATYQQLSADPNSLSNLDQDLPNFTQHEIPIFSLPQEWLWCESWCSDASKATAKTIDLCNNPLHKEPKLEMAKRVIKGELFKESWEELDRMVGWPEPL